MRMHDPFPIPPPAWLVTIFRPLAEAINSQTLHLHIHEILLAALVYNLICSHMSPALSRRLFPTIYPNFSPRTKLNWDVHVVSLIQSLFINFVALYVMWADDERRAMGWEERVWGYTGAGGMIQGLAAGYFLWDLGICMNHLDVFGWGLLAHAIAALSVFSFGFRPFVNFYGPTFILYELSSPFLNLHWFFDKLNMTGSRPQWYNGMLLLSSFFCCRLLWGTYQSVRVYQDVWAGLHYTSPSFALTSSATSVPSGDDPSSLWPPSTVFEPLGESDEIMRYAHAPRWDGTRAMYVPSWLAMVYLGSNIVLNTLNFYWFGKMIETVQSRFREPQDVRKRRWKGGVGERTAEPGPVLDAGAEAEREEEGVMMEGLVDSSAVIDSVLNVEAINGTIGGLVGSDKKSVTVAATSGVEVEEKTVRKRVA